MQDLKEMLVQLGLQALQGDLAQQGLQAVQVPQVLKAALDPRGRREKLVSMVPQDILVTLVHPDLQGPSLHQRATL